HQAAQLQARARTERRVREPVGDGLELLARAGAVAELQLRPGDAKRGVVGEVALRAARERGERLLVAPATVGGVTGQIPAFLRGGVARMPFGRRAERGLGV